MGVTINNESTKTEPPHYNGQHPISLGGGVLNAFNWYQIFALYSVVVEAPKMLCSYGGS